MYLKSHDTLLLLKYWSIIKADNHPNVRAIADSIGISAGEVSKSTKRLIASRLVVDRDGRIFAESKAMLEWLCFGVRYAYPQESEGYGRGMATSWNCLILDSEMIAPLPPLVWAVPSGDIEGILIKPFHKSVPIASAQDDLLYQSLSLLEAIRGGKPRELAIARKLLTDLIKGNNEK